MATYAQLRDSAIAKCVWWVEFSGIGNAYTSSRFIISSLFTDGVTNLLTFMPLLHAPGDIVSKSIDLLSADPRGGGLSLSFTDAPIAGQPDGHFTWLLGGRRSTIGRTRLTADVELHTGGGGHNWPVASNIGTDATLGYFYCGLETVQGTPDFAGLTIAAVNRSRFNSEAAYHRGRNFGGQVFYQEVSDHPIEWAGRIVTLFQTFIDANGALATTDGTKAGCRAAARKFRGIFVDSVMEGKTLTVRCDGIEKLLDRQIMRSPPRARLTPRFQVYGPDHIMGMDRGASAADMDGGVLVVSQVDAAGNWEEWNVGITAADLFVSAEEFIRLINEACNPFPAGFFSGTSFFGQLTFSLDNAELSVNFTADAGTPCRTDITFDRNLSERFFNTRTYWEAMGINVVGGGLSLNDAFGAGEYTATVPRDEHRILDFDNETTLQLAQGPDDSPTSDFTTAWGQDVVTIESGAGQFFARVLEVTPASNTIRVTRAGLDLFGLLPMMPEERFIVATAEEPVFVRRIYMYNAGPNALRQSSMELLLSTGVPQYNNDSYDVLPVGVGAAYPSETMLAGTTAAEGLVDVDGFDRFFAECELYVTEPITDLILEPTPLREWLARRVAFFNGHLVIANGQLSVRKGLGAARHESREAKHKTQVGVASRSNTHKQYARGVHYFWAWSPLHEKFMSEAYFSYSDVRSSVEDRWVERKDFGVRATPDQIRRLAEELLSEVSNPGAIIKVRLNSVVSDVEPGTSLLFSDEGADEATERFRLTRGLPNADGTRGHNKTPTLVLSARGRAGGELVVELLETLGKKGGYSPTAWINSFVVDTPGAGTTRLTCTSQFFSPLTDGTDVSRFVVGEKVRVVRVSCPTGSVRQSAGHTISAINTGTNTVDITPNVAGAGIVSGETLVLVHDSVWDATQPQTAKNWAGIGDASGDIDDVAAELCYDW